MLLYPIFHLKKLLYQLYHTILQYILHPKLYYFTFLLKYYFFNLSLLFLSHHHFFSAKGWNKIYIFFSIVLQYNSKFRIVLQHYCKNFCNGEVYHFLMQMFFNYEMSKRPYMNANALRRGYHCSKRESVFPCVHHPFVTVGSCFPIRKIYYFMSIHLVLMHKVLTKKQYSRVQCSLHTCPLYCCLSSRVVFCKYMAKIYYCSCSCTYLQLAFFSPLLS